jgi:hypothetical protein
MTFTVPLTGAAEVPPVTTTATGTATITVDTAGNVTVAGAFTGLTSNATLAHIHGPATATTTADPISTVPLTVTMATAGAISGNGTVTAQQRAQMISGMTYINVHSVNHVPGEIRGQIQ